MVVCGECLPVFTLRRFCFSANSQTFSTDLAIHTANFDGVLKIYTVFDMSVQEIGAAAFPKNFCQSESDDLDSRLFYASGQNRNNALVITSTFKWYKES